MRKLGIYSPECLDINDENWVRLCRAITHLRLENGGRGKEFRWDVFEKLEFVDVDTFMLQPDLQALVSATKGHLKVVRCEGAILWEKVMS